MSFCTNCGKKIKDNQTFCIYCGERIEPWDEEVEEAEEEAYEEEDYEEEVEEKRNNANPPKKTRKKMSVLEKIGAVLVCILLFVVLLVGAVANIVKNTLSEDTVTEIVDDIEISDITVGDLMDCEDSDMSLSEYIYSQMDEEVLDNYGVTEKQVEELLEEDDIKDFLTDIMADYCDYICTGDTTPKITSKKIISLVEDNEDKIYEITGYQVKESDYELIRNLEDDGTLDALDVSVLEEENSDIFEKINLARTFLSTWVFIIIIIVAILLCVAIFFLCERNILNAACSVGIVVLIDGIVLMVVGSVVGGLSKQISGALSFPLEVIKPIVKSISENMMQPAVPFIIVGGVIIVIRIAVYCIVNKMKGERT